MQTLMNKVKCNLEALKKAIDEAGGMQKLANAIGVSYQTILNWKSARTSISAMHSIRIEEVTRGKVTRKDILPEYFSEKITY